MQGYIGNTDENWYSFLLQQEVLDEVNFWKPLGNTNFKALREGAPFFFKLKKKYDHAIVGFGLFAMFRTLPIREAWELFGERNGVVSFAQMWQRVEHYVQKNRGELPLLRHEIGCILLVSPIFFSEPLWVRGPEDWKGSIVQGKGYDLTQGIGERIWNDCLAAAQQLALQPAVQGRLSLAIEAQEPAARYGNIQLVRPRLGQGTFRLAVIDAYKRCAITGEHSLPALEAAHIQPFSEDGPHLTSNGLLLRADLHRLFDKGYVTVDSDLRFHVSPRLREEYNNGRVYYELEKKQIFLPLDEKDYPNRDFLAYHKSKIFLAS